MRQVRQLLPAAWRAVLPAIGDTNRVWGLLHYRACDERAPASGWIGPPPMPAGRLKSRSAVGQPEPIGE
jgi:hypothetical protein